MNKKEHLPIGTVVKIPNIDEVIMITTLFPLTKINNEEGYFDFGGTNLPLGVINSNLIFFNKEDIDEVIFIGYIDIKYQQLQINYDELVSKIEVQHFTIDLLEK